MSEKGVMFAMLMLFCVIGLIVASPFLFLAKRNVYKEHTGIVVSVVGDSWIFPTTRIEMIIASGSTTTILFNGFHDFKIGQTYKITTQGGWFWYAPNLISAEEVEGGLTFYTKEG